MTDTNTTLTEKSAQIGANGAETPVKENLAENTKPPYNRNCNFKNTAEFEGGTNSFVVNCTLASGGSQDERNDCMENSTLTSDTSTADVDNVTEKPVEEEVKSPETRVDELIERGNVTQEEIDALDVYIEQIKKMLPTPSHSAESEKKITAILFYILNDRRINGAWNEYGIQTFNKICQGLNISPTVTSEPVEGGGRFNKHEYRYNWQFTYTDFMKILQFTADFCVNRNTSKGKVSTPSHNTPPTEFKPMTDADFDEIYSSEEYAAKTGKKKSLDAAKINAYDVRHVAEYYVATGQMQRDSVGSYVCPICGSGSGSHGTGLKYWQDGNKLKCFGACGQTFSVIDLVIAVEGLEFYPAMQRAVEILGVDADEMSTVKTFKKKESQAPKFELPPEPATFHFDRAEESQTNLQSWFSDKVKDWRGLHFETLRRAKVGYLDDFEFCGRWRGFYLPFDNGAGTFRMLDNKQVKYCNVPLKTDKEKQGELAPSSLNVPPNDADIDAQIILVVEGFVNGLSILQATDWTVYVVSCNAAPNYRKCVESLFRRYTDKKPRIVVLFDNDLKENGTNPGQTAALKALEYFRLAGFVAVNAVLTEQPNFDANDILQRDGAERLKELVNTVMESARQALLDEESRLNAERASSAKSQSQKAPATSGKQDKLQRLAELKQMPSSPERDAEIIRLINQLMKCTKDGTPLNNSYNAKLIFEYDPCIDGLFAYDEFTGRELLKKNPSWDNNAAGRDIEDTDIARLRLYIRDKYREFHNEKLINDFIIEFSRRNAFHKVKDYLNHLPSWDKCPRAETLFIDYLNVTDTAYTREITIKWLIGAVARILHSGCNFQLTLVLTGRQGIGKSYILERLSAGFFSKLVTNFDNDREAALIIQNAWLVEVEEFVAARKAEISSTKSFLTKTFDDYRAPYDKRPRIHPRHCVFAVTNNGNNFLRDLTGNRRYGILECGSRQSEWKGKRDDKFIQQVWSEVLVRYKEMFANGFDAELLNLSDAAEKYAASVADQFVADDDIQAEITSFLDIKLPPPEIWILLTKSERRSYFEKSFVFLYADDIERRIISLPSRYVNKTYKNIISLLDIADNAKQSHNPAIVVLKSDVGGTAFKFYGTTYRQHICASEIYNECFSPTDKRKSIQKIADILDRLTDWQQVGRKQHLDAQYSEQRKCYYRVNDVDED